MGQGWRNFETLLVPVGTNRQKTITFGSRWNHLWENIQQGPWPIAFLIFLLRYHKGYKKFKHLIKIVCVTFIHPNYNRSCNTILFHHSHVATLVWAVISQIHYIRVITSIKGGTALRRFHHHSPLTMSELHLFVFKQMDTIHAQLMPTWQYFHC